MGPLQSFAGTFASQVMAGQVGDVVREEAVPERSNISDDLLPSSRIGDDAARVADISKNEQSKPAVVLAAILPTTPPPMAFRQH